MPKKRVYIMIVALVWLTISLPFVYCAQKQLKSQLEFSTNTTEEKVETGGNTLSEYLHEAHVMVHVEPVVKKYYKCHSSNEFISFHPEFVDQPPELGIV